VFVHASPTAEEPKKLKPRSDPIGAGFLSGDIGLDNVDEKYTCAAAGKVRDKKDHDSFSGGSTARYLPRE